MNWPIVLANADEFLAGDGELKELDEDLGFHVYEDPLADDDIYIYVKLKQQLRIPILATE